jgi:hypothetical protein
MAANGVAKQSDHLGNQRNNPIKVNKISKLPNAKSFNLPQLAYFTIVLNV